jgi:hypothetical protein
LRNVDVLAPKSQKRLPPPVGVDQSRMCHLGIERNGRFAPHALNNCAFGQEQFLVPKRAQKLLLRCLHFDCASTKKTSAPHRLDAGRFSDA